MLTILLNWKCIWWYWQQDRERPAVPIDISATPFGLGSMGGLNGLSNLGMGSANFMDLQQSLQREVIHLSSATIRIFFTIKYLLNENIQIELNM